MKTILSYIVQALLSLAIGAFMAVMFLEWMSGCGETYVDAKGVRHQNECLFILNKQ